MEEILVILKSLEHENQTFHESVVHLQTNQASTSLECISATQPQPKKPHINLPDKFDKHLQSFEINCQPNVFGHLFLSSSISN
jgi:hypothetical protein